MGQFSLKNARIKDTYNNLGNLKDIIIQLIYFNFFTIRTLRDSCLELSKKARDSPDNPKEREHEEKVETNNIGISKKYKNDKEVCTIANHQEYFGNGRYDKVIFLAFVYYSLFVIRYFI